MSQAGSLDLALPSGLSAQVFVAGDESARPLVYLHSAAAVTAGDAFLLKLAEDFRVYAPVAPGFRDLDELENLVTVQDVAIHYDDILAALDLRGVALVGHSFGGMFAAELAALAPGSVDTLALIAPVGLWNEDYPVLDIFATPPLELGLYMWADPGSDIAMQTMGSMLSGDEDGEEMAEGIINTMQGLITAGKYMMPIPDRGLNRRLYRVSMPTLLIWGREDKVVPASYAKDFGDAIQNSSELILDGAGHMVTLECLDEVTGAIKKHSH